MVCNDTFTIDVYKTNEGNNLQYHHGTSLLYHSQIGKKIKLTPYFYVFHGQRSSVLGIVIVDSRNTSTWCHQFDCPINTFFQIRQPVFHHGHRRAVCGLRSWYMLSLQARYFPLENKAAKYLPLSVFANPFGPSMHRSVFANYCDSISGRTPSQQWANQPVQKIAPITWTFGHFELRIFAPF